MRKELPTIELQALKQEILQEARVVRLPMGTAEVVAEKVAGQVVRWAGRRSAVTQADLNRRLRRKCRNTVRIWLMFSKIVIK